MMYSTDLKVERIRLEANKERKKLFVNISVTILIGMASGIIGVSSLIYPSVNNYIYGSLNFTGIVIQASYFILLSSILTALVVLWSISKDVAKIEVIEDILDYRKNKQL